MNNPNGRGVQAKGVRELVKQTKKDLITASTRAVHIQSRNMIENVKRQAMGNGEGGRELRKLEASARCCAGIMMQLGNNNVSDQTISKGLNGPGLMEKGAIKKANEELQKAGFTGVSGNLKKGTDFSQMRSDINVYMSGMGYKTTSFTDMDRKEIFESDTYKGFSSDQREIVKNMAKVSTAISYQNTMNQIKNVADSLYQKGIVSAPAQIDNLRSIKKVIRKADLYTTELGIGNISRMSRVEISKMMKDDKFKNLSKSDQAFIRELSEAFGNNHAQTILKEARTKVGVSGIVRTTFESAAMMSDDQTMKGIRKIRTTQQFIKPLFKGAKLEFTCIYKGVNAMSFGLVDKGIARAAEGVKLAGSAAYKKATTAGTQGVEKVKLVLQKSNNQVLIKLAAPVGKIPTIVGNITKTAVRGAVSGIKIAEKGIENTYKIYTEPDIAMKKIGDTAYTINNKAAAATKKFISNTVGKTKPAQFANRAAKSKAGKAAGKLVKAPVKAVKAPLKVFGKFAGAYSKATAALQKFAVEVLKKVMMKFMLPLCAIALGGVCIVAGGLVLLSAPTMVFEAVTNKAGEMKQDASMTAAYNKLLEKEQAFSAAIQSVSTSEEIPSQYQDEHGITVYTDLDVKFIDGNGNELQETSTIKQILAMAAIYIEQDFNKYGAFLDGSLTDSVYKDYCAKLYDASHIIAIAPPDESGEGIYYCSGGVVLDEDDEDELTADEMTDTRGKFPAMEDCNNKTEGIEYTQQDDRSSGDYNSSTWIERLSKLKKDYSAVVYQKQVKRDGSYEYMDYYTIAKAGPHGKSVQINDNSSHYYDRKDEIEEQFKNKGCKSYKWIHTGHHNGGENSDDYDYYSLVCTCPECKGHIDATTYVYIGNIFDPARDENVTNDKDAYSNVEKKDAEDKYSLYTVDKYATAFDEPDNLTTASVMCTNPSCESYYTIYDDYTGIKYVTITRDDLKCPDCGTELAFPGPANPGDEESCNSANRMERYSAEKAIMDTITGKDTTIVEWWKNDGWFEKIVTDKTYYRLYNENGVSIDSLKKPDSDTDRNVVNKSNSKPYWFDSFTEPSKRNNSFAKHGWDDDSIAQVRMLLAGDWDELYGMKYFGGLNIVSTGVAGSLGAGSGMNEAQIAQMLANNTEYEALCDDRKALMATCLGFYSEIKRLGVNYHGAECTAGSLEDLKKATSKSQVFTTGYPNNICTSNKLSKYHCSTDPGIDCSGFVSWIAYAAFPGQFPRKASTSTMVNSYIGTKLIPVSNGELLPGDIALKKGHVLNGQRQQVMPKEFFMDLPTVPVTFQHINSTGFHGLTKRNIPYHLRMNMRTWKRMI